MSAVFLPILSPKCPNIYAAIGLVKYVSPNVEIENIIAASAADLGKNNAGQIKEAADPAMKKSYHSMTEPTDDATATFESSDVETELFFVRSSKYHDSPKHMVNRDQIPRLLKQLAILN